MEKYERSWKRLLHKATRAAKKEGVILNALGTEIKVSKQARKMTICIEDQGTYTLRNEILVKALLLRPTEEGCRP
jgi:uncharacterized lipoprotein NlpE involved in copper resistance